MRTTLLYVVIITIAALSVLSGCVKRQNQTPPTKAPTDVKTTTQTPSPRPTQPSEPAAIPETSGPAAATDAKAGNPTVTPAPGKPMYLGQVLVAWNTGKRGEAVNQFLQLNWQDPAVFQGVPVFTMSEQQLAALPQAQRDAVSQQAQQLSQAARDLARAVVATTDTFLASGNVVGARSRLEAVQQFGQALAAPERLQIIQLVGKAIGQLTQEKLAGIK